MVSADALFCWMHKSEMTTPSNAESRTTCPGMLAVDGFPERESCGILIFDMLVDLEPLHISSGGECAS